MKRPRGPTSSKTRPMVSFVRGVKLEYWYHGPKRVMRPPAWFVREGDAWVCMRGHVEDDEMPKKPGEGGPIAGVSASRKPTKILKGFGELASFLTDVTYSDGTPVGNVQLTLRTRGPMILCQLKMAAMGGMRLQVEDACLDDALVALEGLLLMDPVPWEPDPYPLDGGGKKKK